MTPIQPAFALYNTLIDVAPRLKDKFSEIVKLVQTHDWTAKPYVANDELTCAVQRIGEDFFIHLNRHKKFRDPLIAGVNASGTRVRLCVSFKTAEVIVVKRLLLENSVMKECFNNEKQLQNFDSPSIIRLRFAIEIRGKGDAPKGLLGLDYCRNGDLVDYINVLQDVPYPPQFLERTMLSLLQAITQVHDQGLVHGDIKLNNIFLTEELEAKLADFGFCAKAGEPLPNIKCALNYLAPEVAQLFLEQENIVPIPTKEADMWAIGCALHGLLYRETPSWFVKEAEKNVDRVLLNIANLGRVLPAWIALEREKYKGNFFVELLYELLEVDPSRRIKAVDALSKVKSYMETAHGSLSR